MGIKLHTIQWCVRLLGNQFSCLHHQHHHREPSRRTLKLIDCEGLVKIYDRPVQVSELMIQFPKHMVCRSDSLYIGQKIPPLSINDKLHLGHNYFLLPKQAFQSALSFVTIASFANARHSSTKESRNAALKKASAVCQPFHIEKSSSGCLRIRVSDEFIRQLMEESKVNDGGGVEESRLCNTPQLQKRYALLVGSSRRDWKPKLETIKEMKKKKKIRKISIFGMKRKNKSVLKYFSKKKSVLKNNVKSSTAHRSSQQHVDAISCEWKPKIKKIKSSRKL